MNDLGEPEAGGSPGEAKLGGVVLCRAGSHRLAFVAGQVAAIELWALGGRTVPHARQAFALPVHSGRLLLTEEAEGLVVDALEVAAEPPPVLPAPQMLIGGAGGALRGFLSIGGELWPLLRLPEFTRFVQGLGPQGAPA